MLCHKCKKDNSSKSKFCRFCGTSLSKKAGEVSQLKKIFLTPKIKKPLLSFAGVAIVIVGVVYGGVQAYAYYQVEAKISLAKELQTSGNYTDSTMLLDPVEAKAFTDSQKDRIESIMTTNTKFLSFKHTFDTAVLVQSTTTTSADLEHTLSELQLITSDYPGFAAVQSEIAKIQAAIVETFKKDSEASKKAAAAALAQAERNKAAAAEAQSARLRAEENAQAAANAATQADAARSLEVMKSFRNELTSVYNSYLQGVSIYGSAIQYSNASQSILAISQANSADAVLSSAYRNVEGFGTRFSGLPSAYYKAADDMMNAISRLRKAIEFLVDSEGTSLDYSATINSYKNSSAAYAKRVATFLDTY